MGYQWQRWMPAAFRAAGLTVVEVAGWENRGRPASTGAYDPNGAQTKHHTGTTSSAANPHPTLGLLITGRPDLPGPLAPWTTGADGTIYVLAAGRCNHAGRVGKSGVPGMPYGADGNALAMGDEIDTNGTQTMPEVQRSAVAIATAVTLEHFDRDPEYIHRHADISGTGKWDLGSLTTNQLRDDARNARTQEDEMADYAAQLDRIEASTQDTAARVGRLEVNEQRRGKKTRQQLVKLIRKTKDTAILAELEEIVASLEGDE